MKKTILLFALLILAMVGRAENYPYRSDALWVTVPNHADWLYHTGEKAKIDVELYLYGSPVDGVVEYTIANDNLTPDREGTLQLKRGRGSINIGTMHKPGFRDLRMKITLPNGSKSEHHVKVGFDPEKITAHTSEPTDFDDFWRKAIEEDKRLPLSYTIEPVGKYTTDKMRCYLVRMAVTEQADSMYGYLFVPTAPGKHPAVLCPPGAGVKTIKDPLAHRYYGEGGMIRLETEIHGCHPELTDAQWAELRKAKGDYLKTGWESPETYYMKKVYLGCRRFLDLLTSLPEWDGRNLFLQGGSQGGALAITTTALDPRVTACVANHPALADMTGYLSKDQTGGYPHHFRKDRSEAKPEIIRTLEYFDVVNFARRLRCPVRMTWGYNDNTCPPTTSYAVYNVITAPKHALLTPVNEHWTSVTTERAHFDWLRTQVK